MHQREKGIFGESSFLFRYFLLCHSKFKVFVVFYQSVPVSSSSTHQRRREKVDEVLLKSSETLDKDQNRREKAEGDVFKGGN